MNMNNVYSSCHTHAEITGNQTTAYADHDLCLLKTKFQDTELTCHAVLLNIQPASQDTTFVTQYIYENIQYEWHDT